VSWRAAFFAFSFVASSIYCFNDIIDVEDDRRHVEKCHRPIASGKISVAMGYALMFVMLALSIALSFALPYDVVSTTLPLPYIIIIYWLMEMAYCIRLKRIAIIDLCILSMGFLLRIAAGGAATGILLSHWLIMMTFLLTLFLGFAKRRDDVLKFQKTKIPPRHNTKRYNLTFVNDATTVTGSVMLVCYIMYTVSPSVTQLIGSDYVYLTSVFVILGLLRYMQLTLVDEKSGDPTKMLYSDHFLQLVIAMWFAAYLVIIYV
jgi:4-hydroxybenzoate polyprenyltransferase